MLEQETIDRLHELRLPKMADAYLAQDSDERWKQADFDTRFAALVDAEHRSRVSNRRVRLLKLANLDQPHARLEEINYTSGRKLNRKLIERLGGCRYIDDYRNIFITGATGEGKTYLACALAYEAIQRDIRTLFVRMPDFLTDMELARRNGDLKRTLKKYTNPRLLVLDEWLLVPPNEQEVRDIAELIQKRRRHASTIFCSQYDDSEWIEQLGNAEGPLAEAILDRIIHDAYRIKIEAIDPDKDISMREVYGLHEEDEVN